MVVCEYVVLPLWLHESGDAPLVTNVMGIASGLIRGNYVGCDRCLDCWVVWVKGTSSNAMGAEGS